MEIKKVMLWWFEVGEEVRFLPKKLGGVNIDLQDQDLAFELFADAAIGGDKRSHDDDPFGLNFGRELLCRLDVPDPARFGEVLDAREFPQKFAIQVNDGIPAFLKRRLECDRQGGFS